jgi:type I restriction enzyme, S subunit
MIDTNLKYLKFTSLSETTFWDYYTLNNESVIHSNFPLVKLGDVLTQRKISIIINDNDIYKRCRVQIQGRGVILRDEIIGKEIKTKKQQLCKTDDFLVAEIDAKVGGYGIVPSDLENSIVSSHYFLFEINKEKLMPSYLGLVVKQYNFSKQVKSTGSTNYSAIRPYHVLEYQIPLPSLSIQKKMVDNYNSKKLQAESLKKQGGNLEDEIENYFLEQLGLKAFAIKEKKIGLQIVEYVNFDRWDYFSADNIIAAELLNSNYTLTTIGSSFYFAKRGFNKSQYKADTFKYIEIGAIDPTKGILEAKEVNINKAPSRATQVVKENDLIIGTTRPYLKKFALVTKEYDSDVCSSGFSVIQPSPNYHLPFLLQFLKCTYGIEQLKNKMTGGLYPAITEAELKEIKVPLPSCKEQIKIMELIEKKKANIVKNGEHFVQIMAEAETEFEKTIFN